MDKFRKALKRFEKAFRKYEEIITTPAFKNLFKKEFLIEITTKRFEYTYESMWKCAKEFLRSQGIECYSPKSCFQALFKEGLIPEEYEEIIGRLVEIRNWLVHVYDEETAEALYEEIADEETYKAIKVVLERIEKHIKGK
jgi:nucleotidyltransferase substrate binding protein (TIGR01987 family)